MSLFKKIFGAVNEASGEEKNQDNPYLPGHQLPVDELFMSNFRKNAVKFINSKNLGEEINHFLNVLKKNDWFKCKPLSSNPKRHSLFKKTRPNTKGEPALNS